jgi:hypothetical protein
VANNPDKVLTLVDSDYGNLVDPHYFGEYEAIVVEPTWNVLGLREETGTAVITAAELMLQRRSNELDVFFENGGLLVVYLIPVVQRISYTGQTYLDNHVWWARHLGLPYQSDLLERLVSDGSGVSIRSVEPGHAFEAYLESGPRYHARLGQYIARYDHVTVLATNRAGEPVAAEVAVEAGSVVIVPPPDGNERRTLLAHAVEDTLKTRFGLGFEWKLPEELELDQERSSLLRQLRNERKRLDDRRAAMQRIKVDVFKTTEVRRALNYWREATGPGATPKRAMFALHSTLEMLTGYFGTGRSEVAQTLGVSHKSMNRIAELANRRTLNLRHTMEGDPDDIDPDEYNRILSDGHAIIQAFINYSYGEATKIPTTV